MGRYRVMYGVEDNIGRYLVEGEVVADSHAEAQGLFLQGRATDVKVGFDMMEKSLVDSEEVF